MSDLEWTVTTLKSLADSIEFIDESTISEPLHITQAIYQAIEAIQQLEITNIKVGNVSAGLPMNSGVAWTDFDKYALSLLCDENRTVKQISSYFNRTKHEIKSEILRQGLDLI